MASYEQTRTSRDKVAPCDPFIIWKGSLVRHGSDADHTIRIVVHGKRGLPGYVDVPVATAERLLDKDRLGVERWEETSAIPEHIASLIASLIMQTKAEQSKSVDQLMLTVTGSAAPAGDPINTLDGWLRGATKNIGIATAKLLGTEYTPAADLDIFESPHRGVPRVSLLQAVTDLQRAVDSKEKAE